MHNGIQNQPEKRCTENSIPSSQSRHEVCSQGEVEKGSLGSNNIYIYIYMERERERERVEILVRNW